ncbi:MAG TPA: hypothetical protein VGI48_18425 [Caldimonas sp.]|jgi:hypothetical protein
MDKHLVGLAWGLPPSFVLPSVAACRRALVAVKPPAAAAKELPDGLRRGRI